MGARRMIKWMVFTMITFVKVTSFAQITNKGRDFWVGYGHHQFMELATNQPDYRAMDMVLYLSAEDTATVTVTIFGSGGGIGPGASPEFTRVYKMKGNTVISTGTTDADDWLPKTGPNAIPRKGPMPKGLAASGWDAFYNCTLKDTWGAEPPANAPTPYRKKGIHITSTADIVAYAHIYGQTSSGATMLLPTKAWGYNYTAINGKQDYAPNCYGWMYVIADHDNTYVEITPSQNTKGGRTAGVPFNVLLNKGEIYQVAGVTTGSTGVELTGTRVRALAAPGSTECYPVAVFCGSSRTLNPSSCGTGGGDNDNQQMFAQEAWGKRYLLAPLSGSAATGTLMINMYKIVTNDPTTVVKRKAGAGQLVTLTPSFSNANGSIYYFESGTADYIESDKPIMVAQFMSGGSACLNGGLGDPEMIYLSPLEQAINRIGFYRNTYESISINYLTMVIPTEGINSLKIDNVLFSAIPAAEKYSAPIAALPGYSMVAKKWVVTPKGLGAQCIVTSDSLFNAVTYGLGTYESYGYNAGTHLNNLNIKPSIRNVLDTTSSKENPFTCTGSQFDLSIFSAYKPYKIEWLLSQSPYASPTADVSLGNLSGPLVAIDSTYINGNLYFKYKAPGGPYTFDREGTHVIPVRLYHPRIENCYSREDLQVEIEVRPRPKTDFNFVLTGCPADSVRFEGKEIDPGYEMTQWLWKFPGGLTANGINAAAILPVGTSNITMQSVSIQGCITDTIKPVTVPPGATADFTVDKTIVCEDREITFTPSPSLNATQFFWDFGDGTRDTLSSNTPVKHLYKAYDTLVASLTLSASGNCSPISSLEIIVKAKPVLAISYPAGCLPIDGIVQFNSLSTVPDDQTVTTHLWDFGDPNATPLNPNTAAVPNPMHTYQYGTYDITYRAGTNLGCTGDTVIKVTFNIKPDLAFAGLPYVCGNAAAFSVAKAEVKNNVPGTGVYKGPGTNNAGNFDPKAAGPGTHTIWYVYSATSGCIDSIAQTIKVNAAPQPDFTFPSGCLPVNNQVQFTNQTTIADAQTLSWNWFFDDPASDASNPNTSTQQHPAHRYNSQGVYNVKLTVTSQQGCLHDTTIVASLAVRPALVFTPLNSVCEKAGMVSVAQGSVTNGVTGSAVYKGPGTSAGGQFNPALAGAGTHAIWYVFTSNGGCSDSLSQTITVKAAPKAMFTATPSICANGATTLTDQSTLAGGTIRNWNWNYGDGSLETRNSNAPFTHAFTNPGSYTIQLSVEGSNGCFSDTAKNPTVVNALPVVSFQMPVSICMPGGQAQFTNGTVVQGGAALTYIWDFGDNSQSTLENPTHVYSVSGAYTVLLKATSAPGCVGTNQQVLDKFFAKPLASFTATPNQLCQGTPSLFADNSTAPGSPITGWNWSFGDGTTANTGTVNKTYAHAGNYNVKLQVTNAVGCNSDTAASIVHVYLQPVIDAGKSFVAKDGALVQFEGKANSPSLSFRWTPGADLSDPTILTPTHSVSADQLFTLTATGDHGCTASDTMRVTLQRIITVPNAFSPNGDGINDRWVLQHIDNYPKAEIRVFDRFGTMVHQAGPASQPWDGFKNGKPLPVAVYYYIIKLNDGEAPPMTGSVTLLK